MEIQYENTTSDNPTTTQTTRRLKNFLIKAVAITVFVIIIVSVFLIAKSFSSTLWKQEEPSAPHSYSETTEELSNIQKENIKEIKKCLDDKFTQECTLIFEKQKTEEVCSLTEDYSNECFYKLAETTMDSDNCALIEDYEIRKTCYEQEFIPIIEGEDYE